MTTLAKEDNVIRSYDFPHMLGEYMEGRVTSVQSGMLTCETTKVVRNDLELNHIPDQCVKFTTAQVGEHMLEHLFDNRITILG